MTVGTGTRFVLPSTPLSKRMWFPARNCVSRVASCQLRWGGLAPRRPVPSVSAKTGSTKAPLMRTTLGRVSGVRPEKSRVHPQLDLSGAFRGKSNAG